ncbi:uncharacterized protein LOC119163642 [Rhipicephalus microplus]|uniref:uncharacterized protein LOC119163642 n=1 Tax=Rhipicephalus microplus TaxID=6941 RepID=UPI003F6B3789
MSGSDASVYLSAVRWDDTGVPLQEFLQKFPEPQVARVVRGQHRHVGVPSLSSPGLSSVVFLSPLGTRLRISAQCVKFKENRQRVVALGPRLAIPEGYRGWFEILSEDGRASRCFESVAELMRRSPDTCLVREPVKAHLAHQDNPEQVTDKTRTLQVGETLVVVKEHTSPMVRASLARLRSSAPHGRFLRCLTSAGETVYLSAESRGKFSPIAKEGNISGVHSVKTLLCKRFPLMVRLVHGRPAPSGLKTSELRLYGVEREECVLALPLVKDAPALSLPESAPLRLQAPKNADALVQMPEYTRLTEKSKRLQDRMDAIEVLETTRSSSDFFSSKTPPQRSLSEPNGKPTPPQNPPATTTVPSTNGVDRVQSMPAPDDYRYEEIDQIYDYVRGFAPLPEKIKTELIQGVSDGNSECEKSSPSSPSPPGAPVASVTSREKPLPPPIETIPARRYSMATDPGPNSPPTTAPVLKSPPTARAKDTDSHVYEAVIRRSSDEHKPKGGSVAPTCRSGLPRSSGVPRPPNNKLFVKSSHQVRNGSAKPRMFRNAGRIPVAAASIKDASMHHPHVPHHHHHPPCPQHHHCPPNGVIVGSVNTSVAPPPNAMFQKASSRNPRTCRGTKPVNGTITTSPLFNIRYKSLTNLAVDFNDTLDSSNSGGGASSGGSKGSGSKGSGSKGSKHDRTGGSVLPHKLSRPKSLSNLFWDVEANNRYNLLLHNELKANQFIYADLPAKIAAAAERSGKKVGTLYL